MKSQLLLMLLLLAPALAACSNSGSADAHFNGNMHVSFDDSGVKLVAAGHPDAHVTPSGDLIVGRRTVEVTPSQRAMLVRFYDQAEKVRDDGIATGKAGAEVGVHAIGSVVSNLLSGTPDKIGHEVDSRGKTVEAAALHLCNDLQQIKSTQSDIAAQLPAFQPYAVFGGEVHCDEHDSTASR
ncbi:MAG: hypothetical protein C4338_00140 [Rhodanobacteraceae bacterium]